MSSQHFLLLSCVFGLVLGLWYFLSLKKTEKKTSMLDLDKPSELKKTPLDLGKKIQNQLKDHPRKYSQGNHFSNPSFENTEKMLNVLFNYNGHTWDAYEVLGIPAGTSLEKVTEALHRELRKQDPNSHHFLQAAYQAILSQY
jgi:hypothetical protein